MIIMKKNIMIASDLHGSFYYTRCLIEAYKKENPDMLLLLGDILYHGPRNDLPKEYNPKGVIELLNGIKQNIRSVRGNCDAEVDQMVLEFPIMAPFSILMLDDITIYATHGHINNIDNPPILQSGDILLYGHTHIPASEKFGNNNIYLNPGSVSIPKNGSVNSYMMIKDGIATWKNVESMDAYKTYNLK